jgi:DNA topoisomerase-2
MSATAANANTSKLAQTYQKKTDKEHILDNPDTYTGSMECLESQMMVFSNEQASVVSRLISFIPGFYKLFDEAIVNSYDHSVRLRSREKDENVHQVSTISVSIETDEHGEDVFTFMNDGNGIDVEQHPTYKIWIPEMIFAHLRTGTNYDKSEKKIVGGKNGFGAKLIFIWSKWGQIETIDHVRGLKYVQEFEDNLDFIHKPKVTKSKKKPYTIIRFKPDYTRLGMSPKLSDDLRTLFHKRALDVAAMTDKSVKVKFNGELLPVKTFPGYIDLYIGSKGEAKRIYEVGNDRWEYAVALSPTDEFQQVSFVNGIATSKGGKHVEYIMNQIVKKLTAYILKKKKIDVKSSSIKEQLMLFLRCDIENPAFDSQTKDFMSSPVAKFGSTCAVSDAFIDKIAKMGVMKTACELTSVKNNKTATKTDGSKTRAIRGIPKLVDANFAGGPRSKECTIILCEGDSAKAGIVSGLSKEDRNFIGVYPMRGKLFNVRGETMKRVSENKEIVEIKKILGLETNRDYTKLEHVNALLRYGKILFMTDQDLDGSHIKGLGINLFHYLWEPLIAHGIIGFMNTPILKARKGKQDRVFYNDGEYDAWKASVGEVEVAKWSVKYYKGLGTSTSKEFKQYFQDKKNVMFSYDDTSRDDIDMVFNKKRADDRKTWLRAYDRSEFLDTNAEVVSYSDFIHREMKHFSKYDCDRSIPNLMDGLKISQRKIVYGAFKKNLIKEIKVAQLSGYVSEQAAYHHGEQSLNSTIVGLAQDYVGSNNINLLLPNGQFGTRLSGGKDSASERYIFTALSPMTRGIFRKEDEMVLNFLSDDGDPVEPAYYAPILPIILVNGAKGIGTGFSTDIMPYNPIDLRNALLAMLSGKPVTKLSPYYRGFNGHIIRVSHTKFLIKGIYEHVGTNKIRVTELPIGTWTDDYKQHLEKLIDPGQGGKKSSTLVRDYVDQSTDKVVDITITFAKGAIADLEKTAVDEHTNMLEKTLKLVASQSTANMYLFNANDQLKKYDTAEDILKAYFATRIELYQKRIAAIVNVLEQDMMWLSNKVNYILGVLDGSIDLRKKKLDAIDTLLKARNLTQQEGSYKYLTRMPMDSVSEENVAKLMDQKHKKETELIYYKQVTPGKLWKTELQSLEL